MQIKCWFVPDIKTKHKVKYKFYELFVTLFLNFCCLKYEINYKYDIFYFYFVNEN